MIELLDDRGSGRAAARLGARPSGGCAQEGRFAPAIKVGRRLVWDARDVDAWLDVAARDSRGGVMGVQRYTLPVRRGALPGACEVAWPRGC